ncbi:MAG TPA: bacillithiol biosynthesis cysteine-adding enzyme BshC [Acidobacteriaceae bacterium]
MEAECYPSSIVPHSSRLFLDYTESAEPLTPFYSTAAASKDWISQGRKLSAEHRARLADLLAEQNEGFGGGTATAENIERLRAGASAVVTGQQVALFGGPLYTLLKAATAIARAREATAAGFDTVPVFWLASEDHDFAEVAEVGLPDRDGLRTISIGPPPEVAVPVGGIRLGARIETALTEVEGLLGTSALTALLREAYRPEATLAGAFGSLMARLFARWGLVVIDAASSGFHALGAKVLEQAIREADGLHRALVERDTLLVERRYHAQVKVGEQSSLLFLIDETTKARLPLRRVKANGGMQWKAGGRRYSSEELLEIVQATPERCSPNALLRPVFQDAVLPTSAYVAGPAEIAYFAQSEVLYRRILGRATALLPRLSATLVEPKIRTVMERHEVRLPDALTSADGLAQRLAARAMPIEGKRKLAEAGNTLDGELTAVTEWMAQMDAGLGRAATTAASKMRYQMNRLRRLAARYQLEKETSLARHAQAITQALYPGGHLQERAVAGMYFVAMQGEGLLEMLVEAASDSCPGHKVLPL